MKKPAKKARKASRPVKLSKDIDSINRPVATSSTVTVKRQVRPQKPRRRPPDYDDILDDLWL